jgi:hypothetical protein
MSNVITLTNDFHNTSATVRPAPIADGRYAGLHKISRRTTQRLQAELCGVAGCMCSGNFGERGGPLLHVVNEDYDRNYIVDLSRSNG